MTGGTSRSWTVHWPAVMFANRTTIKPVTGMSPYQVMYGQEAVLPIELDVPTWATLAWDCIHSTADLLALRACQIEQHNKDMEEVVLQLNQKCFNNKEYFNDRHQIWTKPLKENNPVLLHNTLKDTDMSTDNTLQFQWLGPYQIHCVNGNGSYTIKELDGSVLHQSIAGNCLKCFHFQGGARDKFVNTNNSNNGSFDALDNKINKDQWIEEPGSDKNKSPEQSQPTDKDWEQEARSWIPDDWDFGVVV